MFALALLAVALAPTPMPRPSIGGIRQAYCPIDGYVTLKAEVQGGKATVKVGDNIGLVVTINTVNCDLVNTEVGMALGGGLKGDGLHEIGFRFSAAHPYDFVFGAQAVQPGTWSYTADLVGYSFGTTDPGTGAPCRSDTEGGVAGWICERSASARLTIMVTGPASPTPRSTSSSGQAGSSGGSSQGQGGGGGTAQAAAADSPGPSAPPLAVFSSTGAARRLSAVSPPLLIALAVLLVAMSGLAFLLIRRRVTSPP